MKRFDESRQHQGEAECIVATVINAERGELDVSLHYVGIPEALPVFWAVLDFLGDRWLSCRHIVRAYQREYEPRLYFGPDALTNSMPQATSEQAEIESRLRLEADKHGNDAARRRVFLLDMHRRNRVMVESASYLALASALTEDGIYSTPDNVKDALKWLRINFGIQSTRRRTKK
jgi:hypothetical protein